MIIRCWGSRGSIPVSGPEFENYGGDTTCLEIRTSRGDCIVIDSGTGIRNLGTKLVDERVEKIHMLFTHAHLDHIMGFPFFGPILKKNTDITIYGCPYNGTAFKNVLRSMMTAPYFPVDLVNLPAKLHFKTIQKSTIAIGSLRITPIFLNHPNGGLGYRLEENGKIFVFLTDNELRFDIPGSYPFTDYVDFCRDADLLIHDAEFDVTEYDNFRTWGHSTYGDAVRLGLEADVQNLGLFHLNNKRTDKQVDMIVKKAKTLIRKSKSTMKCAAISNHFTITL